MKVSIGTKVASNDFGPGIVIAMTLQWCIYRQDDGVEIALPWDDIHIAADPLGNVPVTDISEYDLES